MSGSAGFSIGVVLSPRPWASQLHAYATDHVADLEVIVVRDQRAALETGVAVLVVDETTPWLNAAFVDRAERAGVTVVGVWDPAEPKGEARLVGFQIPHRMASTLQPADALYLLQRLRPTANDEFDQLVAGLGGDLDGLDRTGAVIAVGGPPGSGSREVGIGLAAALSGIRSTVLVDANESSPGVARRLGVGLYPHLLSAADALKRDGVAGIVSSTANVSEARLGFDVMVGLPSGGEWDRLAPRAVEDVLQGCRVQWERTVVVTSPVIEDLRRWVDRFGVSRHVIGSVADEVIGVCEATPRGVLRFADWLADLSTVSDRPGPMPVVLNRVPKSRFAASELIGQLQSICGDAIGVVAVVPEDSKVATADWNAGLPASGGFTKAVGKLAGILDGVVDRRSTEAIR
jgi:CO dehydrogenase nickel-insertion accessory protein CooC1